MKAIVLTAIIKKSKNTLISSYTAAVEIRLYINKRSIEVSHPLNMFPFMNSVIFTTSLYTLMEHNEGNLQCMKLSL